MEAEIAAALQAEHRESLSLCHLRFRSFLTLRSRFSQPTDKRLIQVWREPEEWDYELSQGASGSGE